MQRSQNSTRRPGSVGINVETMHQSHSVCPFMPPTIAQLSASYHIGAHAYPFPGTRLAGSARHHQLPPKETIVDRLGGSPSSQDRLGELDLIEDLDQRVCVRLLLTEPLPD